MSWTRKLILVSLILVAVFLGFYLYIEEHYYPPILMYHQIDKDIARINTIAVSADIFARQMEFIKRHNYRVVSLEELCRMIKERDRLPRNLLAITFDDGYKNNLAAVRILKKHNFPATIFIVISWIGKPGYLNREDLDWIARNSSVTFGSHTLNHSYLPEVSAEEIWREISGSKQKAKREYGLDLSTLAYPVGGFTPESLTQVKESGYLCACTTNRGFSKEPNIYALRRIKITNRDLGIRLWGKLSGFYTFFKKLKPPN